MYLLCHEKAIGEPAPLNSNNGANDNSLCSDFILLRGKLEKPLDGTDAIGSHQDAPIIS